MCWRRRAVPGASWIASGTAATMVWTAAPRSSIPPRKLASLKKPWSTATSKHFPSAAKRRLRRGAHAMRRSLAACLLGELYVDRDLQFLANQQHSSLHHMVERNAEVLAINDRRGGGRDLHIAVWVLGFRAWALHREHHLFGDSLNREVADELALARTRGFDAGGLERDCRIVLHVQEIGSFDVGVALVVVGIDRCGVDVDVQLEGLGVGRIELSGPG